MKEKLVLILLLLGTSFNLFAQSNDNWQFMGKVVACYGIKKHPMHHGEESYSTSTETLFLYSEFDGKKLKYKIFSPKDNASYEVFQSAAYNGSKIEWDRRGQHIIRIPRLGEMYTHYAGPYYFNVGSVHQ